MGQFGEISPAGERVVLFLQLMKLVANALNVYTSYPLSTQHSFFTYYSF
jgi:hypothetical protein